MREKIAFLHIGMARDGAERVIARLANKYAEKGYDVDILVLLVEDVGYEFHDHVRIVSLVRKDKSRIQNVPFWIREVRKYIKKNNPKHIISFSMYVNLITLIANLGLKKKILISERNDPSSDGRGFLAKAATYLLYGGASKVVFQTERAMNCFPRYIKKKGRIITNPVEVECEASCTPKKKIVTIGRLEPQKNQRVLIEAFGLFCKDHPDYELEIFGEGSLRQKLSEQILRLGLADNVKLRGNVQGVHHQVADAQMFVLSSDYEGLSNALLEAMMMGLPCISTRCAGSDEVIQSGDNGILVDIGSVDGLYKAMTSVADDIQYRMRLSTNAKKSAARFRSASVIDEWMKYIES